MAEAGKRKSRRLLRGMIYLLGLGTLLGLLAFFLRIWSWEPSDLSKELLLETGRVFRCELQVQKTELRMFPFPRVFWHGASLSWGENVHAQVKALRVGPDFLSMAIGRIRISYLELDGLGATDEPWRKLLVGLRESMEKNLQAPFLDLRLSSARVEIKLGAEQLLLLSNFNGRLNRKLSGVDLRLGFDVEGPGKGMPLKGVVLEFSASGNLISAYKGRIRAQEPLLDLTTELRGLSHQGFDELLLASPSLDLASARSLLQVLGKALPVPSEVWERLEKGKLLNLELKIPGGSLGTLWENPGAELRGRLQEGKLLLPGPWGVLQDLEAGFKISGGTLELSSLRAKAAAGSLQGGSLKLGLTGPERALFAQAWFEADLRQLHRVLGEWVREEPLGAQIRALYKVGGKARGKLVLQGPGASPGAWLEVQELDFVARHKEFPYAIEIRSGSLLVAPGELAFEGLRGTLGSSSFSEVSGSLDFSGENWLDVRAGPCMLELEEIWALLEGRQGAWDLLENVDSLEGRLKIKQAEINGPLLKPRAWKGRASASLEGRVAVHVLGVGVNLKEAELEITQESISLKKAKLEAGGERFQLDADCSYLLGDEQTVEASVSGHIGPQIWGVLRQPLSDFTGVSWRELPRAELLRSRFNWSPEGLTLEAELSWEEKPRVSVDLILGQDGLRIRQLQVQDDESKTLFSLDAAPDTWELALDGHISGATVDFFIEENLLGRGRVEGKAKIRKNASDPLSFTGEITAEAIPLGRFLGGRPWELIQGKLAGDGREIVSGGARLKRMDTEVILRGKASFWENGLEVSATLETMALLWDELGEMIYELSSGSGASLTGNLGLRVGQLQVGETSVSPFHADLQLDPSNSDLDLKFAVLCGVNLSGRIQLSAAPGWTVHPVAKDLDLKQLLGCLGVSSLGFTGKADLDGEIQGQGFESSSMERVRGTLEVVLHQGEIQAPKLWPRILEAVEGLSDFRVWPEKAGTGGISLEKGRTNLEFHQGNLKINELWFEGGLMRVLARGDMDLFSGGLRLQIELEPKGMDPKGSRDSKREKPSAVLALEGSLEEPRVHRLPSRETPTALPVNSKKPQAKKKKADTVQKTRKSKAQ